MFSWQLFLNFLVFPGHTPSPLQGQEETIPGFEFRTFVDGLVDIISIDVSEPSSYDIFLVSFKYSPWGISPSSHGIFPLLFKPSSPCSLFPMFFKPLFVLSNTCFMVSYNLRSFHSRYSLLKTTSF